MRKKNVLVCIIILLCLVPFSFALAKSGTVTASSLNIRKKASAESSVVGVLRKGATVTIKDTSGSWYKITSGGKTGYVYKKYIKIGSSSSSSSSSASSSSSKTTKKETTTEFDPDDHDIDLYYEDYKDVEGFDDIDDAYDDFEDNPEYWDDY